MGGARGPHDAYYAAAGGGAGGGVGVRTRVQVPRLKLHHTDTVPLKPYHRCRV